MASSDITVLDRQRARLKWLIQQQQQQQQQSSDSCFNYGDDSLVSLPVTQLDNSTTFGREQSNEILGFLGTGWPDLAIGGYPTIPSPGLEELAMDNRVSGGSVSSPPSKKRKGGEAQGGKVGAHPTKENPRKKTVEPKVEIPQPSNDNSNDNRKETSEQSSKENSIASALPPQKSDYIHVRARRGQATDSHSLAERVRREKISERMKYLQDLVPGCNKITGRAGMLDEIINYVQSLQKQVEFLSMKLAAVNPRLDINVDQLFNKEINLACSTSFPTIEISSEVVDLAYQQFNAMQNSVAYCGLDMVKNASGPTLGRTANVPMAVPDGFTDSFYNIHGPSLVWDTDMQNLNNLELQQGRGLTFPFQLFQGNILPNNSKTEL